MPSLYFHPKSIIILLLLIATATSLTFAPLNSDCLCPKYNSVLYEAKWLPPVINGAPGTTVFAQTKVTNNYSAKYRCSQKWTIWYMYASTPQTSGKGWVSPVYESGSGCRNQSWEISAPFDNSETTVVCGDYHHNKAGGLIIRVSDFMQYPGEDGGGNGDGSGPSPGDGGIPGGGASQNSEGDPVSTWSGAFRFTDTDYKNSDLQFRRIYNSQMLLNTYIHKIDERWKNPMGIGWQHNFNISIKEIQQIHGSDTTNGCLLQEAARFHVYIEDSLGNYHPKRANHSVLKKSGSIWKLYKPNGLICYFASSGKIDSIVDRNGRKTSFSYSGSFLSQVAGKHGHTLSFSYNSDSLLKEVSITENSKTKKFEYRYEQAFFVYNADTDTIYCEDIYYLAQVLQHYNTGAADSLMSIYRYYYDNSNFKMVTKIYPQDAYSQSDTVWKRNYKKGDRIAVWYDSLGNATYQEIIEGDGDTLVSNDKVMYKSFTKFFLRTNAAEIPGPDSAITYLYQTEAGVDSAHDPYDTTFTPQPPTSNYATRKRDYHNNKLGRQIIITTTPNSGTSFTTRFYKGDDFNDSLIVSPDNDTTIIKYKTYIVNGDTLSSPRPVKIKYQTGDSILHYYHAPDNNAPSFFLLDSTFDELGRKTRYKYDSNYNLDSVIYVSRYVAGAGTGDIKIDYTYNSVGNLTQIKDARGNSTYFSYAPNDTGHYLTQTKIDFAQANADIITKYKYNTDIGKVDTTIYFRDYPSDSSFLRYTYDVMNRLKETYYPDGTYDLYTYDKRGNLLKKQVKNTAGGLAKFKMEYEYDAMAQLKKVKEYANAALSAYDSTLYGYNLNGELISFKNANDTTGTSTEVQYKYDAERLIKVDYPDTTFDSLSYYKDGNLKFKRDRKGQIDLLDYDRRGRLTKKYYFDNSSQYPGSPQDSIIYSYDAIGNMTRMIDFNDTINYNYDGMDNLDTLDCYQTILTTYEYDKSANKKKLKVVNYSTTDTIYLEQSFPFYDEANRLEKTIVGTDTFYFNYWDTGQIKKIEYPNGMKEQYKLTSRNFIDIVTDSNATQQLFKYDYKYNDLGDRDTMIFRVTRVFPHITLTGTASYKYDDLRRITEAKYPASIYNKTNKYTYDNVSNRLKKVAGTDTMEYAYNKRNNQLKTTDYPDTFLYDDNGNLIKRIYSLVGHERRFTYNYDDLTTRIVKKTAGLPTAYDTLWFEYCGMGKRIKKIEKIYNNNPDTTKYAFDGMYTVCEFGGHLDLQYKYIYANGLLLARYDKSPADTHYYHHDGLGSMVGLTNENAIVEQAYFYDEFGNSFGSWGSVSNNYLYIGQEYDGSVSQLYNLRARLYDMRIGRFNAMDPLWSTLREPQEYNKYVYVINNPINFMDRLGLDKECTSGDIMKELAEIESAFKKCVRRAITPFCGHGAHYVVKCMEQYVTYDCCEVSETAVPLGPPLIHGFQYFLPHAGVLASCWLYRDKSQAPLTRVWDPFFGLFGYRTHVNPIWTGIYSKP